MFDEDEVYFADNGEELTLGMGKLDGWRFESIVVQSEIAAKPAQVVKGTGLYRQVKEGREGRPEIRERILWHPDWGPLQYHPMQAEKASLFSSPSYSGFAKCCKWRSLTDTEETLAKSVVARKNAAARERAGISQEESCRDQVLIASTMGQCERKDLSKSLGVKQMQLYDQVIN
eukprot:gnl/TRDRNA2_/TRDRNA2_189688_c0_seq1.p1 gnl/TRDRNA2_/TRDRNA2_189688_c0~~gnl/TRDRNA2_/TRDRNA2_189688_c0_seq1.p1  ORF type:complete len:174 (+),score=23.82 gnl/TRDRNA2_/TRDRNA2_189688_c0_seq1:53-574(+)